MSEELNKAIIVMSAVALLLLIVASITQLSNKLNLDKTFDVEIVESVDVKNFYLEVAKGNVQGHSSVNKFGHNGAATSGDDVWGGGGVYAFYPTSAQQMYVVSSDNNDANGDTGARTIIVYGLNDEWLEISETITLTGTTPVILQNNYIRMFRAVVLTAGSTETNEGDILVKSVVGDTTAIFVAALDGQTQHAIYTIPAGKEAYFIKGYVAIADDDKSGEVVEFQWQARLNNGVTGAWAVKGEVGLNSVGTSSWQYLYGVPSGAIPPKTDIRIKTISTTATIGVVGGFDLILVSI